VRAKVQQILSRHMLSRQHAVNAFQGELSSRVKKIGQVRLAEAGLPGKE